MTTGCGTTSGLVCHSKVTCCGWWEGACLDFAHCDVLGLDREAEFPGAVLLCAAVGAQRLEPE